MAFLQLDMCIINQYDLPSSRHMYSQTVWPSFSLSSVSLNSMTFLHLDMCIIKQYGLPSVDMCIIKQYDLPSNRHMYSQTVWPSFS